MNETFNQSSKETTISTWKCTNPNCVNQMIGSAQDCRHAEWHMNLFSNYIFCSDHNKNPY
jgi:hypothetical protein